MFVVHDTKVDRAFASVFASNCLPAHASEHVRPLLLLFWIISISSPSSNPPLACCFVTYGIHRCPSYWLLLFKERDRRRLCAQRATQCKKEGNDLFRRKKRRAACERYTDAITAFPHEVYNGSDSHLSQKDRAFVNGNIDITHLSIYYSNRAMAKLHLREYKGVLADSIAALRLNKHNPKASYFLGLLYLHCFCSPDGLRLLDAHDPDPLICAPTRKSLSMAVAALTAAEEGARREGRSRAMIYEYRKIRLMARKHEWILKQLKEQQKLLSLQAQCIAVLGNLKASGGSPRPDVADLHAGQSDDGDVGVHNGVDEGKGGSTASASGSTGTITPTSAGGYSTGCRGVDFDGRSTASGRSCDDRGLGHQGRGDDEEHRIRSIEREKGVLGVIEEALEDVAIHCHDRPVPDFLCCKITFEPMLDPVMTPSGHSFERAVLERYIAQNPVDPISRKPLYLTHLVPNLNLREAVEEFLMEQPWSYDHGSRLEDTIDPEYMARHSSQQGVGGSEAGTQRKAHFSTTVLREELIRLGIVKGLPHQGVKGKG